MLLRKASYADKAIVVRILCNAFADNRSVLYLLPKDRSFDRRLKRLMTYSFDCCFRFGEVYISDDNNACALTVLPETKSNNAWLIWQQIKLVTGALGLLNTSKALKREALVKQHYPTEAYYYIWYIGVEPANQGNGAGSALLRQLQARASSLGRAIYLETSTVRNLPWYGKNGFNKYGQIDDFGFPLYLLRWSAAINTAPV